MIEGKNNEELNELEKEIILMLEDEASFAIDTEYWLGVQRQLKLRKALALYDAMGD